MIEGLQHLGTGWGIWDCSAWTKRRFCGCLIEAFQYLKAAYRKDQEGLFIRESSDRRRDNSFKLKEDRFILDTSKKFFIMRVVRTLEQVAHTSCG